MQTHYDGRLLYHAGFYDGPLSGVVEIDGKRLWFEVDPDTLDGAYEYYLYELTLEEWEYEDRRHELFQKYVGTHCDYDEFGKRDHGGVKPMSEHHKFYDAVGEREVNYTKREPFGRWCPWVDESEDAG